MENDVKSLLSKLDSQAVEIAEIKKSVKRIQAYFFWTLMITLAMVVLPAIGLLFAIPKFLQTFGDIQSLGL